MTTDLEEDLDIVIKKMDLDEFLENILHPIRRKLVEMWRKKLVKSNHSVMEFVVAAYLATKGYVVDVEVPLPNGLVADVIGISGEKKIIIEIETGFVPPEHSIDPIAYRVARETSKVARYSKYADTFIMATPPYHVLQIPEPLLQPPELRYIGDLEEVKILLDRYYSKPPITIEELSKAHIDYIYLVNVDTASVYELRTGDYLVSAVRFLYSDGAWWRHLLT